jgi:hypothetical protein
MIFLKMSARAPTERFRRALRKATRFRQPNSA